MRLVLANRLLDRPGGEQKQLVILAEYLAERGHEVTVITNYLDREACYPRQLSSLNILTVHDRPREDGKVAIRGMIQRAQKRVAGELLQAADAKRWAALVPPNTEIINWHGANPQPAYIFSRSLNHARWVWMCNDLPGPIYDLAAQTRTHAAWRQTLTYKKFIGALPRAGEAILRAQLPPGPITVLDETNKGWWKRAFGREAIVMPWGLDYPKLEREVVARPPDSPLWLMAAGIMSPYRRFEDAIDAVAIARNRGVDARLRIIGVHSDLAYVAGLVERIASSGHSNAIELHDFLPSDVYERYRRESHLLLLTTRGQTWGQVTTECAAAGIPAVINETATTLELMRDGHSTYVARWGDPESIAEQILRADSDEPLRQTIARNAQHIASLLSWDRYCRAMEEVFVRTIAGAYD